MGRGTLGTGMMAPLQMANNFNGPYYAGPSGAAMGALMASQAIGEGFRDWGASKGRRQDEERVQGERERGRMDELNQRQAVAQAINPNMVMQSADGMSNRDMTRKMQLPDVGTQTVIYGLQEKKRQEQAEADYKKKEAFATAWAAKNGYREDPTGEKFREQLGFNPYEFKSVADVIARSEEKGANMDFQRGLKQDGFEQARILAGIAASNRGGDAPKLPSAPGYETYIDENGQVKMRPILGGPADLKLQTADGKQAATQAQMMKQADMMLDSISTARNQIDDYAVIPNTGWGSYLSSVPGTAFDLSETLGTIKGRIGFNELQQMRQNSPTGGALGQVAVQELEALQKVLGSLQQKQSASQLKKNLTTLEETYLDTIHGAGNWKRGEDGKTVVFSGAQNAKSRVSGPVERPQGGSSNGLPAGFKELP